MEKTGRLIRILLLLQAYGVLTAQELAKKLEVTERTIYRDIDALTLWGVPISSSAGHGGGYSLPDGYTVDPAMFTGTQVAMLSAGGTAIRDFSDFVNDQRELEEANAKLLAILSEEEREIAVRHLLYIYFDHSRWYRSYAHQDILGILKQAVLRNHQVILEFRERDDPRDGVHKSKADAYGLVFKSDTWYFVGFSHNENKLRRWNVTRILDVQLDTKEFVRSKNFSLPEWWKNELESFGKGTTKILISVNKNIWHRFSRVNWKEDNRFFDTGSHIIVEMMVDNYEWLIDMILVNRGDVEVLEPLELREKLIRIAERLTQIHRSLPQQPPDEGTVVDFEILSLSSTPLD